MNRKTKTFCLAFVAALSMAAVIAPAGQAQFTSTAESTTITGNQVEAHKFTAGTGIGGIACTTVTYSGSQTGKSASEMRLTPTYSGCKDSLGRIVHITTNTLDLHLLSGILKGKKLLTGHIGLVITTGSGNCNMAIAGPQTINGITYTNNGDGSVTVTTHSNNITTSISGGFFNCGTSATHSSTGTYTGTTKLVGNGGAATISVD